MLHSVWEVKIIQEKLDHSECLNFGSDGRLYAGGELGQVYVVDLHRKTVEERARTGGFTAGIVTDSDHNVYLCDVANHRVAKISVDGVVSSYCSQVDGKKLVVPNYCVFDEFGNLFFSESGDYWHPSGRLIKIAPNGAAVSLIGDRLSYPNGLAISPDGKSLLMIESTALRVLSIPLENDGSVGDPEIFVQLPGCVPDGLAFDSRGCLYVSSYYPNIIYRLSTNRVLEVLIEDRTGEILNQPTNVAFAPDGSTLLYFTNLGGWHIGVLDVGVSGNRLRYPKLN